MNSLISLICFLVLFSITIFSAGFFVTVGLYDWLIGGFCQIVDGVKENPTDKGVIALGILKMIFFEVPVSIGLIVGWFGFKVSLEQLK